MKWIPGRQGTGYEKLCIFSSERFKCDLYILRYKPGSYINAHVDPISLSENHHRINIVLRKAIGGMFAVRSNSHLVQTYFFKRIVYFRPDICIHEVTKVLSGTRYVLSLGWTTKISY